MPASLRITILAAITGILMACGYNASAELDSSKQVTPPLVEQISSPTRDKAPEPTQTVNKPLPVPTAAPSPTDTPTLPPTNKPLSLTTSTPSSTQDYLRLRDTNVWNGDACSMPNHSVHITTGGSVLHNSSSDIAGFQFNVDGATVLSASGGEAEALGFTMSTNGTTVLGFSLEGATFSGCGTSVELSLDAEPMSLSSIIVSDPSGEASPFEYFDGQYEP